MSIQGQKQAAEAQARASMMSAQWNADQANKQAAYDEGVAQQNIRRERDNNKRELARRRAASARGGLAESGAVTDNLIEASSRHQKEIDDMKSAIEHTRLLREKLRADPHRPAYHFATPEDIGIPGDPINVGADDPLGDH